MATRYLSNILTIMRRAIARRNALDPDATDQVLVNYINDFYSLTMSDDVKLFEQFGTLVFEIDETVADGVYSLSDVGATGNFVNFSNEVFISLNDPANSSTSWNALEVYQDPGRFYAYWGVNNYEILIPGMPTEMLYYGTEFVFRTIPNTTYNVRIYSYKQNTEFAFDPSATPEGTGDPQIPFDYWLRYIASGAAVNYSKDYKFESQQRSDIKSDFAHERKLLLTRTHNQIKMSRSYPRF
jgi:hypothetical protein